MKNEIGRKHLQMRFNWGLVDEIFLNINTDEFIDRFSLKLDDLIEINFSN